MEYKKVYDPKEIQELIEWFEKHKDKLPESIYINKGTFVKDVRRTAAMFKDIAEKVGDKKSYGGHIRQFFILREEIIKHWEEEQNSASV